MKTMLTAAAFAAMLASGAMAQTVVTTDYRVLDDDAFVVQPWNVTVDDLDDMDVYGADGEEVGDVEEVLINASGEVVGITVEVGGFLGIGEKEVIVPLSDLNYVNGQLVTALTADALELLPEWDD